MPLPDIDAKPDGISNPAASLITVPDLPPEEKAYIDRQVRLGNYRLNVLGCEFRTKLNTNIGPI